MLRGGEIFDDADDAIFEGIFDGASASLIFFSASTTVEMTSEFDIRSDKFANQGEEVSEGMDSAADFLQFPWGR